MPSVADRDFYRAFLALLEEKLNNPKVTVVFVTANAVRRPLLKRFIELKAGEIVSDSNSLE
jgi:ABC-type lipoprotein export system ATPase subunit